MHYPVTRVNIYKSILYWYKESETSLVISEFGDNIISGSLVTTKLTNYKLVIVRYNKKTNICECIDENNKIKYLHKNFLYI